MENNLVKIFEDVAGSIKAVSGNDNAMTPTEFMDRILATGDPKAYTVSTVDEMNSMKYVIPGSTATIEKTTKANYVWGEPVSQFLLPKYISGEGLGNMGYNRRWSDLGFAMEVDSTRLTYWLPSDEYDYVEYFMGENNTFERHTEYFAGDLTVNLRSEISIPYKDSACDVLDDYLFVPKKERGATYEYIDKTWVANTEMTDEDLVALNSIMGDDEEIQIDMSDEQINDQLDRIIGGNE